MKTVKIAQNTTMLLILNIAKLIFPFITLPYLTRVLSTDAYGMVAYVKAVMSYMQIIVDFGFILSGTKNIVLVRDNKQKIGYVVGNTLVAKIFLTVIAGMLLGILTLFLPLLRKNIIYTLLSYIVVFLSIFLMDFLFRGLEIMHIITIRFVIMKSISTLLTFFIVKSDKELLMIPALDILGSMIAILLVSIEINKMQIPIKCNGIRNAIVYMQESAVYFISNVASTSFNVLNTIIIGTVLSSTDVAYWSVCIQIVCAVQALYTPISDGIYPEMVKSKSINLVKKIMMIFMPIVFIGCVLAYALSSWGLLLVGGKAYVDATTAFRCLVPVMFFGFPAMILGWPMLGAINRVKEATITTVLTVVFQLIGLLFLIVSHHFTLFSMAVLRSITECILFITRFIYCCKYKNEFRKE